MKLFLLLISTKGDTMNEKQFKQLMNKLNKIEQELKRLHKTHNVEWLNIKESPYTRK
jgi:hypothetical protein